MKRAFLFLMTNIAVLVFLSVSIMIAALERLKVSAQQPHLPEQMAAFGISGGIGQGL
jgi:Co/Zn/Cd efflux system component